MNKGKSTALGLVSLVGLAVLLAGTAFAPPSQAQSLATCSAGSFDACFPNLDGGAPNAACTATEPGAAVVSECLARVCRSAATEPEPGFFSYCCARGGSVQYDDFCVFVVQSECPAVALHCEDRCPPLELLVGTVTLAPPTAECVATYPAFVRRVCEQDPFCCTTSWDGICAEAALAAGGAALVAPAAPAAATPAASSSAAAGAASAGSAASAAAAAPAPATPAPAPFLPTLVAPAVVLPSGSPALITPAN